MSRRIAHFYKMNGFATETQDFFLQIHCSKYKQKCDTNFFLHQKILYEEWLKKVILMIHSAYVANFANALFSL